jgi:hypothetical protein
MLLALSIIQHALTADEKVVLFSSSAKVLRLAAAYLAHFGLIPRDDFDAIDGTTPAAQRQAACAAFNDAGSPCRVMLAAAQATGAGVSFVGAARVVLYEPQWCREREAQMVARVFRFGQARATVTVNVLVADTPIEQRLAAGGGGTPWGAAMTKEALLAAPRYGDDDDEADGVRVPGEVADGDPVLCAALRECAAAIAHVAVREPVEPA